MDSSVLPHVQLAREVLALPEADLHAAFVRRAQLAALPAVPAQTTVEVPAYLIDLGLRRWRDPALLFARTLKRNSGLARRWKKLDETSAAAMIAQARRWESGQRDDLGLCADVESLVIFTGDDARARALVGQLDGAAREPTSARLAIVMATVLSQVDPRLADRYLVLASELSDSLISGFLVGIRRIALAIKRLKDFDQAYQLIEIYGQAADQAQRDYLLSAADADAARALLLNLRALMEVRLKQLVESVETMQAAAAIMPASGFVAVPVDMADRYRAQVRVNVVQALWAAGHELEALQRINAHVVVTRTEHLYSLSEALTVAAYFNELAGEHAMALSYCIEAERLLTSEGAPTRLAMCRRIAAAALNGIGKRHRAEVLAKALVRDQLGDHRLV